MNPNPEISAAAAKDAYLDRRPSDANPAQPAHVFFDNQEYTVLGYKDNPLTGFHATAYKEVAPPHNIIIAYRGTDPDFKHHTLTTAQDTLVDATMVRDQINPQEADARAFTQAVIDKAARYGISKDQITVAGHSLGGTLAEIEASEFGLGGATFNAYGAAGLGYGISEGGAKLTDYVMAGDVVSAASPHHGTIVPLASNEDVLALKAGRYMEAAPGMPPHNPFLTMRFADHSITHFAPAPGSHEASVLESGMLAQYARNYADHKAAFDAFRADVQRERGELAAALHAAGHGSEGVMLPADMRRQLDEYLAVNADPAIRQAIEGNAWVQGAEHRLQQGAGMVTAGGIFVQHQDERAAALARKAGAQMALVNPAAPLVGVVVGEAAHWHGQAVHATSRLFAGGVHSVENAIKQDVHAVAQEAEAAIHAPALQNTVAGGVNHLVDAYHGAESVVRSVEETYDGARRVVSRGFDAVEHAARDAYASIGHLRKHGDPQMRPDRAHPADVASRGFSDPGHPQHMLYAELKRLLPQGTSEARLGQATSACHQAGVDNPRDIERIYVTDRAALFMFKPMWATTAQIDLTRPAPSVEQTLQQVQQYDQQQAQLRAQYSTQSHAHLQQGPVR